MKDLYLRNAFEVDNLKEINLLCDDETTWNPSLLLQDQLAHDSLQNAGIRPTYYLYNEDTIIRYTKNEYTTLNVDRIENDKVYAQELIFEL